MRIIRTLVVLGLCVVAFGFFRGWFSLSREAREAGSNRIDVNLTLDPDKVKADVGQAKQKTSELGNQATNKLSSDG